MKQKRIAILQEIDRLDSFRCSKCEGSGKVTNTVYCDCPSAESIRKLGIELIKLTSPRRDLTDEALNKYVDGELTADLYKKLKIKGFTDKRIRDKYEMCANTMNRWKTTNNLMVRDIKRGVLEFDRA